MKPHDDFYKEIGLKINTIGLKGNLTDQLTTLIYSEGVLKAAEMATITVEGDKDQIAEILVDRYRKNHDHVAAAILVNLKLGSIKGFFLNPFSFFGRKFTFNNEAEENEVRDIFEGILLERITDQTFKFVSLNYFFNGIFLDTINKFKGYLRKNRTISSPIKVSRRQLDKNLLKLDKERQFGKSELGTVNSNAIINNIPSKYRWEDKLGVRLDLANLLEAFLGELKEPEKVVFISEFLKPFNIKLECENDLLQDSYFDISIDYRKYLKSVSKSKFKKFLNTRGISTLTEFLAG